jgi:hypothetical protein
MSPAEILQVTNKEFEYVISVDDQFKNIFQKLELIDNSVMSETNYHFVYNRLFKVRIKKPIKYQTFQANLFQLYYNSIISPRCKGELL